MVTNNEVWMGSGASVTLVPESDLFLGYEGTNGWSSSDTSSDATKGAYQIDLAGLHSQHDGAGVAFSAKYLLVEDLYTGCIADFYLNDGTFLHSRVISGNSTNKIFFNEQYHANTADNCYVIIRKFGTPVVGPIRADASSSTNQPTLLADNWLGLVNSITFPNPEIEMLQKNLALGGSRNFTHQFKGMENAQGGSFEVSANHGAWLYYALGKCTTIDATFTDTSLLTDNFVGTDSSNGFLLDTALTAATATIIGTAALDDEDGTDFILTNADGSTVTFHTDPTKNFGDTSSDDGDHRWIINTRDIEGGDEVRKATQAIHIACLTAIAAGELDMTAVPSTNTGTQTSFTLTQTTSSTAGNTAITLVTGVTANGETAFTGGAFTSSAFLPQGPIFYRKIGDTICPPITKGDMVVSGTQHHMEKLTESTETSGSIVDAITYTFGEANGSDLPSFTLEHVINKGSPTQSMLSDGTDQTYSASPDDSVTQTLRVSDEVFSRIATGNMVNTLTLMANEGEELKMSLDLMTKQIVRPQSNDTTTAAGSAYFARRGVTDERSLINFGSSAGGANNSVDGFIKPFFFHDGSLSMFGQQFLKITNFTLTINNNLQEKRFIGNYKKGSKSILPAQRMYEITLSGLVTDSLLFDQLLNEAENTSDGSGSLDQYINLNFTKENGENMTLEFKDYMVSVANFPIPEDNSPFIVDATIMPRSLKTCTVKTHWLLQG